jgi:hypothetical protein
MGAWSGQGDVRTVLGSRRSAMPGRRCSTGAHSRLSLWCRITDAAASSSGATPRGPGRRGVEGGVPSASRAWREAVRLAYTRGRGPAPPGTFHPADGAPRPGMRIGAAGVRSPVRGRPHPTRSPRPASAARSRDADPLAARAGPNPRPPRPCAPRGQARPGGRRAALRPLPDRLPRRAGRSLLPHPVRAIGRRAGSRRRCPTP